MINYQSILTHEFLRRHSRNPSYSMRGFARDLNVSQSFLSQVLSQKRNLSNEKAIAISEKLKLKGTQRKLFISLVHLEQSKCPKTKAFLQSEVDRIQQQTPQFKILSQDVFNIVADWYYFALLEMTNLQSFQSNPAWISRKLSVPQSDISVAIQRLKKVGLLKEINGRLVKVEKDYIFENVPSKAIRKHHRQTLELARRALELQPVEQREFFTVCFPMDPRKIQLAKEMIRQFNDTMMTQMQKTEPRAVYKLAVQFFRLDREVT